MKKTNFFQVNEKSRKEKSGKIVFNLNTRRYYFENISDKEINQLSSKGFSKPLRVQWRITKQCNLRCKHCYLGDKNNLKDELNKEDLLKIAEKIINNNIFEVLITGGEPTLKEGFYDLVERLSPHCFITIFTNAAWEKIPRRLVDFIRNKKNLKFFISLEGPKDVHDAIRGVGSFQKTMRNIKGLQTEHAEIVVNTVLTKELVKRLKEYLDFMIYENIETLQISKFYPLGEGEINRNFMPSPQEFEKSLRILLEYSDSKKLKVIFDNSFSFLITGKLPKETSRKCSGGISKLVIESGGDCYPCQLLPSKEFFMGNIIKENLDTIWNSPARKKFIGEFFPEDCKTCEYNKHCSGGCKAISYSVSKTFKYKDPYCFKWKK